MNKIAKDTAKLTIMSFFLQGLGLLFNIYITGKLGTASVGIITLVFSFFGFIMVLANGNIFLSTNRLVSEELGFGNQNCTRIMKYSMGFSLCLSGFFAVVSFFLANIISVYYAKDPNLAVAVRIIALSLPLASIGSCIKGYFHANRNVSIPCYGDVIEFISKWIVLVPCLIFFMDKGLSIYVILSGSILFGEAVSCVYFLLKFIPEYRVFSKFPQGAPKVKRIPDYLKLSFPILLSGYVQMIMSSLNEALVPIALLKYHTSAEQSLSEYGMFEAMIIPVIFFPAVVISSLSSIIIPEVARAKSAGHSYRVKHLVHQSLSKSCSYAFFIAGLIFMCGKSIGTIICPADSLVGESLVRMFPVIPFIYLEIVLEGILKGLGKQNFSTINSLCEYIIRIICVIVFVHFYGFTGVLISYYASNVYSNIVRIIVVCKTAELKFNVTDFILIPLLTSIFCCQVAKTISMIFTTSKLLWNTVIYICIAAILFVAIYELCNKYLASKSRKRILHTEF